VFLLILKKRGTTKLSLLMNPSKHSKSYLIKLWASKTSSTGSRRSRRSTGTGPKKFRLTQPTLMRKFKTKNRNSKS